LLQSIKKYLPFVILALVLVLSCQKLEEDAVTTALDKNRVPDQESWQSTFTITQDGKKFAEVWSGYIAFFNELGHTYLKDSIHADFFDKEGRHNSVLTADSGIVYNQTNSLVAFGDVVVVSDSGVVLETEKLRWDNELQKIISDVEVRFTTLEDTLIGDSFISDPDLTNYEIRNARGYSRRKIPMEK
jgi:LPS export ABC transporter protein LptC